MMVDMMTQTKKMSYKLLDFRLDNIVAEINDKGEVIIGDLNKMIDLKLEVCNRLRTWKDGNYQWRPLDTNIVLLGRIAELEKDLDDALGEMSEKLKDD